MDKNNEIQTNIQAAIEEDAQLAAYSVGPIQAHTHNGTDSVRVSFQDLTNKIRYVLYRALDPTTNTSVTTTVGGSLVMPFSGQILQVGATVDTAGTTNSTTIDINNAGTTIMANTKINIGTGTTDSRNYTTTTPAITTTAFYTKDIFTFDIDAISTTPAKGLTIFMVVMEISR